MPVVLPTPPDLVDRLAVLDALLGVPPTEIRWLAAAGELRRFPSGEIILRKGEEARQMLVVLAGRIVVTFEQGTGHGHAIESTAGIAPGRQSRPISDER